MHICQVVNKLSQADLGSATAPAERVVQLLEDDKACLKLGEVNKLLQILWERKVLLEQQDAETNLQLLLHFLCHSRFVILRLFPQPCNDKLPCVFCFQDVVTLEMSQLYVTCIEGCRQPGACVCRQEKSKQLVSLQSELQLLDSDIKQVAGRHPVLLASKPKPLQLQLPSRQHSMQLLDQRLQETSPNTSSRIQQAAAAPIAHGNQASPAASTGAAVAGALQPVQASASVRPRSSGSLPPGSLPPSSSTTAAPPTPALSMLQHLMHPAQPSAQQPSSQPGIILAQHPGASTANPDSSLRQQPGTAAAAAVNPDQCLQPSLARASNGYLMINHPHPSPSSASQQGPDNSAMAAASTHGTAASAAASVAMPPAATAATAVPIPTQMERQQSMHIHPRHLAFQHFHAQQQRQQMERQQSASHAAAGAGAGAAATDSQAATQEAALRYLMTFVDATYVQGLIL